MKVVHIESGLGNQMLSYCELLALKQTCPNDEYYIETTIYDVKKANDYINQWNGYELDRIFGIEEPNIKSLFCADTWTKIIKEIEKSEFWKANWNWPVSIQGVLEKNGLLLKNIRGDFSKENIEWSIVKWKSGEKPPISYQIKQTSLYSNIRRVYRNYTHKEYCMGKPELLFINSKEDIFTGQRLLFKYKGNNIENIEEEIRKKFIFPQLNDDKNIKIEKMISNVNAVSIHARRGDMLTANGKYYKNGYFKRAVRYIKNRVNNPVFFLFCDTDSMEWCKCNEDIFGLNFNKDKVFFVDWNRGNNSYIDMQLMAKCKHNIITNSSFGWWGAYLNDYEEKITISPEIEINTTYNC